MFAFQFNLIAFLSASMCVVGYLISDLTDYRDYDANCVAYYLQNNHSIHIRFKPEPRRMNYCRSYVDNLEQSFYESVESLISPKPRRNCVMSLLKRHNVKDVFFKAIGYNYFKRQLVKFAVSKTCSNVVNVLRVDNDCELREMTVNFIGSNKSLWKLRPCLDDLFGEFDVDEIVFVNQDSRVGFRRFGRHLSSFFTLLAETGKTFCSDLNLNLMIKYFGIESLQNDELRAIYNRTQIDCFMNFFINNEIIEKTSYRFPDTANKDEDLSCDEIMREQVEKVVAVDLFGFAEFSQKVKDCIIEGNRMEKNIERVVIMPAVASSLDLSRKHFEIPKVVYVQNTKRIIEISLACLRVF